MNSEDIKLRFKKVAVAVFNCLKPLSCASDYYFIEKQLLRLSSFVAANYGTVCGGESKAGFLNKLKIEEEEADESLFWTAFLEELNFTKETFVDLNEAKKEFNELLSIVVDSIKTLKEQIVKKMWPTSSIINLKSSILKFDF